jgi:hypothetical protein
VRIGWGRMLVGVGGRERIGEIDRWSAGACVQIGVKIV